MADFTNIANLRGPQGEPGQDGSNVLPADEAIAQAVSTPSSNTRVALSTSFAERALVSSGAAWGSSTIAGSGATSTTDLIAEIGKILGITIFDGGGGGEIVEHHAARSGAIPALLTVTNNKIPASGPVNVVAENFPTTRLNRLRSYSGTLHGVSGTLSYSGSGLVFTRDSSGLEVSLMPREPFIAAAQQYRNLFTILNVGKNNLVEGGVSAVAKVAEYTRRMFAYLGGADRNVFVVGHFSDTGTPTPSDVRTAIIALNAQYAIDFGDQFVDPQAFLTSNYAWVVSGINPTSTDLSDQAAGNKPTSLSSDTFHLNPAGYKALAYVTSAQILTTGRFAGRSLPPLPDPPAGLSNTTAPAITGSNTPGNTLTVSNGSWTPAPDSYTYQWTRGGSNIIGATSATYALVEADINQTISALVTAAKSGFTPVTAASSNSVSVLPTPVPGAITSDQFTGGNSADITGRSSDARLGGAPRTWVTTGANRFAISSGQIVQGSAASAGAAMLPVTEANQEIGAKIAVFPVGEVRIEARKTGTASASSNRYVLTFTATSMNLNRRNGSTNTSLGSYPTSLGVGDVISLRVVGDQVSALRNGSIVGTATDATVTSGSYAGFATASGSETFGFTDFYIRNAT